MTVFRINYILFIIYFSIMKSESARILAVFPTPSISHQVVFRTLFQELAKRGHEVVVITADPAFSKKEAPQNLLEIDVHDISYKIYANCTLPVGKKTDTITQLSKAHEAMAIIIDKQFQTEEVQNVINDKEKKFDLLFVELYALPALGYSHLIKAPVIQLSSFSSLRTTFEDIGASSHPNLYPLGSRQIIHNVSLWENISELYTYWFIRKAINYWEIHEDKMLRTTFGPHITSLDQLKSKVDMIFLNIHPLWDLNRPVSKNVIYLSGLHQTPMKKLPEDLKNYLDNSKNGIVYMSFGTNIRPSRFEPEKIQIILKVLSQLPYDVLLKWDKDLPGCPNNVKIKTWFPQSDLLRHPNIKAFVTQAGLQSTEEAIDASVPLVAIPLLADQWVNAKMYEIYKIGIKLEMETLTEHDFRHAIETVINNKSYRKKIIELRSKLRDMSQTALQRAVWWTEHVLWHGGKHLRAPAANMHWTVYYELDLIALLCILIGLVILMSCYIIVAICRIFSRTLSKLVRWKSD